MKRIIILILLLVELNFGQDTDRILLQKTMTWTGEITQLYYEKALNEDWAFRSGYSGFRAENNANKGWDGAEVGFSYEMSDPSNEIFHSYFSMTGVFADGYGGVSAQDGFLVSLMLNIDFRWTISDYDAIGIGGIPGGSATVSYERRF